MKTRYIICTRFNSDLGLSKAYHVALTEEWLEYRIDIFNRYTRKCLEAQTNQDFLNIVTIHPDSKPIIEKELLKYPPLPPNIIFTADKNQVLEDYIQGTDRFYISNLDSDDMYSPKFIQLLHHYPAKETTSVLICQQGYILNSSTQIIDQYSSISPPFFTQIFDVKEYFAYAKYYPPLAHGYMRLFDYEAITDPMFMVVIHDRNTWPKYQQHAPRCFDSEQTLPNWKEILEEYGIPRNNP